MRSVRGDQAEVEHAWAPLRLFFSPKCIAGRRSKGHVLIDEVTNCLDSAPAWGEVSENRLLARKARSLRSGRPPSLEVDQSGPVQFASRRRPTAAGVRWVDSGA